MDYKKGYVCFIDILGFSSFVKNSENIKKTYDLFEFIKKLCFLFNDTKELNTEITFYSDSIVITTSEISWLLPVIYISESYLQDNLGLLFRGGVCYGDYYHEKGMTFGPGVIKAYELEKQAIYSRIIIDKELMVDLDDKGCYVDFDGFVCLNPYGMILEEILSFGDGVHYPQGDLNTILLQKFNEHKCEILNNIKKYRGTTVVEKYLWRIRPFNHICNKIANISFDDYIYEDIQFKNNQILKDGILKMVIREEDLNC